MLTSYYSNYQTSNRLDRNDICYEQYSSKYSNPYCLNHQHLSIINNNNNNNNHHNYNSSNNNSHNFVNLPVENTNSLMYQSIDSDNAKFEEWNKQRTINYINDLKLGNEFNTNIQEQKSIDVLNETRSVDINQQLQLQTLIKPKRRIKKSRVLFSQWQINELEKLFKKQKYVTSNEREIISKRLKLNPNQVKIWFQNRRYKIKKRMESENNNLNVNNNNKK